MAEVKPQTLEDKIRAKGELMLANKAIDDKQLQAIYNQMGVVLKGLNVRHCNATSIVRTMLVAYHSGLNLTKFPPEAYILGYKNKDGTYDTQLQADYRGLAKLRYQVGDLKNISCEIVLRDDIFEEKIVDNKTLVTWEKKQENRDGLVNYKGVLIMAYYKDGSVIPSFIDRFEIDKAKDAAKTQFVWQKYPAPMIRKSAFKIWSKFQQMHAVPHYAAAVEYDSLEAVNKVDLDDEKGLVIRERKPAEVVKTKINKPKKDK